MDIETMNPPGGFRYVRRFNTLVRSEGVAYAFEKLVWFIQAQLHIPSRSAKRRIELSKRVHRRLGGVVRYGPLRGLQLRTQATWGAGDRAGMLLGLYEQMVASEIYEALRDRTVFIDIGAADGYYAVGLVSSGRAARSVAFDKSEKARRSIRLLAQLNRVQDQVEVRGQADTDTLLAVMAPNAPQDCVILCDVEGAELDVFHEAAFERLSGAFLVIEIHRSQGLDVASVEAELRRRSQPLFDARTLTSGPRDPLTLDEISDFAEDDQWLICSEGRGYRQTWLVLSPKTGTK
jgi:hypothetical protein